MKIAILTSTMAIVIGTAAMADEVRVYNWPDYIDEDLLKKFEQETGFELVNDVFNSNKVLETKILDGGSGYDVVAPSGTFLQRQIVAGAFQKLDRHDPEIIAKHATLRQQAEEQAAART